MSKDESLIYVLFL